VVFNPDKTDPPAVSVLEFKRQYAGSNPEQLAAVVEGELGRDFSQ
jgi:hypothetical protein